MSSRILLENNTTQGSHAADRVSTEMFSASVYSPKIGEYLQLSKAVHGTGAVKSSSVSNTLARR
jgi:hypothetical protein